MDNDFLVSGEVAAMIPSEDGAGTVTKKWVLVLADRGDLPCIKINCGLRLFRRADVEAYITKLKERRDEKSSNANRKKKYSTRQELKAEIARLQAENLQLKQRLGNRAI